MIISDITGSKVQWWEGREEKKTGRERPGEDGGT